jgi:DNA-binding LacI/PurR family transcriptional regulator
LQNPPSFIQPGDFSDHAIEVSLSLLREKPRPTAIIAANDTMALGVMQAAQQLKLRIPEDLSVGGFDDLPNQADRSPLTTVHQPVLEMSERSARLLLEALSKGTLPTGKLVMPVSLTTRKSTGPCK